MTTITTILTQVSTILKAIVPILISLGVVYFIWGVIKYVIADGEEAKKNGKDQMIYGIIGLTVIIGMWGLVGIAVEFLGGKGTAPTLAPLAQTCTPTGSFGDLLCYLTKMINDSFIPLIFALAMVVFIWGVVKFFLINTEDEKKREEGKQYMIWGILALAVMLSVWGLVGVLRTTFHIDVGGSVLPRVKPSS